MVVLILNFEIGINLWIGTVLVQGKRDETTTLFDHSFRSNGLGSDFAF
jgi:hypothetical protein